MSKYPYGGIVDLESTAGMNAKIKEAYLFAKKAHGKQPREGTKKLYIIHPLAVYNILSILTKDENVLIAALLHDVVEDTHITSKKIEQKFGKKVADIVHEVTKNEDGEFDLKTGGGALVKLADMLHNLSNSTDKKYIYKKIEIIEDLEARFNSDNDPDKDTLGEILDTCAELSRAEKAMKLDQSIKKSKKAK